MVERGKRDRMMKQTIGLTEAKQQLGELVKRVAYGGERIVLEFRGKPQAAIVSIDDLQALELVANADRPLRAAEPQATYAPDRRERVTDMRIERDEPTMNAIYGDTRKRRALAALGNLAALRAREGRYVKEDFDVVTEVRKLRDAEDDDASLSG
jgi:prevent-host-death family protein